MSDVRESGVGKSYGCDVVKNFNEASEAIHGDRNINEFEAGIIRSIFRDHSAGKSQRANAKGLNEKNSLGLQGFGKCFQLVHHFDK
ncbi:MAG: hypothetical protein ACU0DI_12105 [Paracoccaceae bacterium]